MTKMTKIVSLLLVIVMVLSTMPLSIFAAEAANTSESGTQTIAPLSVDYTNPDSYYDANGNKLDLGQSLYQAPTSSAYVGDSADFNFEAYGYKVTDQMYKVTPNGGANKVITSTGISGATPKDTAVTLAQDQSPAKDRVSTIDYYVAYDDENIYFVIRDIGAKWTEGTGDDAITFIQARNNYTIKFGFNPDDYTQLAVFGAAYSSSLNDAGKI